jgi:hypothetical protein
MPRRKQPSNSLHPIAGTVSYATLMKIQSYASYRYNITLSRLVGDILTDWCKGKPDIKLPKDTRQIEMFEGETK